MNAIKKFIYWLIELIKSLFKKNKTNNKKTSSLRENEVVNSKNKTMITPVTTTDAMPDYFICDLDGKNILFHNISKIKNKLFDDISTYKKEEIERLIRFLNKNENLSKEDMDLLKNYFNKADRDSLDKLISKYSDNSIDEINSTYNRIIEKEELFTNFNRELEVISDAIDEEEISFLTRDKIGDEEDKLLSKKNLFDPGDDLFSFKERFYDVIKGYDDTIVDEIKKEYKKVNYVTLANIIIDKNIKRFQELEDDFKKHRFNVSYYEREINKIKNQLDSLRAVKNKPIVGEELARLKKELYTKSKDKYDVLYNDEVYININKQCDDLLKMINTKVIDIKKETKEEKKVVKKEKEDEEEKMVKKILLRFEDMALAHDIIMLSLINEEQDTKLINSNITEYIKKIYEKYNLGIKDDFNYQKNKDRTELIIFYNDLNRVISHVKKEDYMPIEHINFRIDDLVEAVQYKKAELNSYLPIKNNYDYDDSLIDEKLNSLRTNDKKIVKVKRIDDTKNKL